MAPTQSTTDVILLAIPMVGTLLASLFRLDEQIVKPRPADGIGHPLSHVDGQGQLVCIEPDGRYMRGKARQAAAKSPIRVAGHLPRRNRVPAVRRVFVEWADADFGQ